jgi:Zn-dependent protease
MEELNRTPRPEEYHREQFPVIFAIPVETTKEYCGETASKPPSAQPVRPEGTGSWQIPLFLFLATCLSTFWAGFSGMGRWEHGLIYSACVMSILLCHEAGHFFQARRYSVPASLPYFIPFPFGPIGTFGAVIAMSSRVNHRRALFDIGISGPLAGLIPTIVFCVLGLQWSHVGPILPEIPRFGEPLILKWLFRWQFGEIPPGYDVYLHPMAWAGWVGLFITSLNLIPIGQLDGGHILYALMPRRAHSVAVGLLFLGAAATIVYWWWLPMIILLLLLGPRHPPTADDHIPLGAGRRVLGWLALAFVIVGFTPRPVILDEPPMRQRHRPVPERRQVPPAEPQWPDEEEQGPILVRQGLETSAPIPRV